MDFTALNLFEGTILPHYTSENFKIYLENIEPHILNRYETILSVSNEEVVVIEKDICI